MTSICGRALAETKHDCRAVGPRFEDLLQRAAASGAGDAS